MSQIINIYCDESCHLQNDKIRPMALGAIWVLKDKIKEINHRIREIKAKNGFPNIEVKWTKISSNHYQLYLDIVDYFFDDDDLHFRGVIVPDKSLLQHQGFNQTHDEWYYKMFFVSLKVILSPEFRYHIYLDYKDTLGNKRLKKLHNVLCNNYYDFSREILEKTQLVKSHQVELIQLVDILTGPLTYFYRGLEENKGKNLILKRIKERSGYSLNHNTLYREEKFNLLIWKPQEGWTE